MYASRFVAIITVIAGIVATAAALSAASFDSTQTVKP